MKFSLEFKLPEHGGDTAALHIFETRVKPALEGKIFHGVNRKPGGVSSGVVHNNDGRIIGKWSIQ